MQTNAINLITINFLREPHPTPQKTRWRRKPCRRQSINLDLEYVLQLSGISQGMFLLSVADKTKKQRNLILHSDSNYNHIMWSKFVNSPDKGWPVAFWAELCSELWPYRIPIKAQPWALLRAFEAPKKILRIVRYTKRISVNENITQTLMQKLMRGEKKVFNIYLAKELHFIFKTVLGWILWTFAFIKFLTWPTSLYYSIWTHLRRQSEQQSLL